MEHKHRAIMEAQRGFITRLHTTKNSFDTISGKQIFLGSVRMIAGDGKGSSRGGVRGDLSASGCGTPVSTTEGRKWGAGSELGRGDVAFSIVFFALRHTGLFKNLHTHTRLHTS